MRKEISTLTRALTTLSHNMVDRSSKCGGGKCCESDRGYATDASEKENSWRPNTRGRPDKIKFNKVERTQSCLECLIKKGSKCDISNQYKEDWKGDWKQWFLEAREVAMKKLKKTNQKKWKKMQKTILQEQMEILDS